MQEITRELLIEKASQLLESGTVNRVLGWKKGEFAYDVTPAVFTSKDELNELVWNGFCGANFSKYLIKETAKGEGKVLVFLKPCDTYSFNQLLTEHRFNRDAVYAVGVPCNGMLDVNLVKNAAEGIANVTVDGDTVKIETLYDGVITANREDLLAERCKNCKSKKHVAYDELLGESGDVIDSNRFDEVEKLEKMTADERFAFWQTSVLLSGRTSFPVASVVTPAVTFVPLAPAKSACSIIPIRDWKTRRQAMNLRKSCSM